MSERTIWTCDGCGDEQVISGIHKNDWRRITVTMAGFEGYPVGLHGNCEKTFELCPGCQRSLHGQGNPKQWARATRRAETP